MTRLFHALCALILLSLPMAADPLPLPAGTQLILLRHADRSGENLNAKGKARAALLPETLTDYPIDKVYSPGFQRNLDTAEPLLAARGLEVSRIPARGAAARMLSESAGQSVVWVGNKGNLKEIWTDLAAPGRPPLNYGEIFILTPGPQGTPRVTALQWGD